MKKSFGIKLAGACFNIDEDALELLEKRIALLNDKYDGEEKNLKLAAEEELLAEKLINAVGENGLVTIEILQGVLALDSFCAETEQKEMFSQTMEEPKNDNPESEEDWYKAMLLGPKLYRNPYESILGGVLSGIANYSNINVQLLRLLVLVATLSLSCVITVYPFFVLYILLWLCIPKAKNVIELTRSCKPVSDFTAEEAWKINYERSKMQMTFPKKRGCFYSVLKLMFIALFVILLLPLFFVIFLLLSAFLVLLFALFSVFGVALFANFYFILLVGIPLLLLIHWILKKSGVCRPMNNYLKVTIIISWLVLLSFVCVKIYDKVERNGGVEVLRNAIIDERYMNENFWENFFEDNFGKFVKEVSYSYSAWIDDNGNIPFVVDAKRSPAFDKITVRFIEPERWNENLDLYEYDLENISTIGINVNDAVSGSIYCFWDSISKEIVVDLKEENVINSYRMSIDSYTLPVRYINESDSVNFNNAIANGKIPFEIRFVYGRIPELYMWGSDADEGVFVAPVKTWSSWSYNVSGNSENIEDTVYDIKTPSSVDNFVNEEL